MGLYSLLPGPFGRPLSDLGGRPPSLSDQPSSSGSARRRPATAWPIRCSFSTSAKRTWPSPPGPKPTPGLTATFASRASLTANSSEPSSAVRLGDRRPDEHRPLRLRHRPADPREAVAERVAPRAVDLADLEREVGRLVHRDDRGDLDRLEGAVVEVRLQPRERLHDLGVAEHERRPASPPSRTTSSACTARPRPPPRPRPGGSTAARGRRRRCRRRRSRGRRRAPARGRSRRRAA